MKTRIIAMNILKLQKVEYDNISYSIGLAQDKDDPSIFVFFVENEGNAKRDKYEFRAKNYKEFNFFNGTPTFEALPSIIQDDIRAGRL